MATYVTVLPAYGRDYKSIRVAREDWQEGKDFLISDITSRYNGKSCNFADFTPSDHVYVRYNHLTKIGALQ